MQSIASGTRRSQFHLPGYRLTAVSGHVTVCGGPPEMQELRPREVADDPFNARRRLRQFLTLTDARDAPRVATGSNTTPTALDCLISVG
jgi:hypothetical protein